MLDDYKLNITAKQIGHKEILWFAAKSGPKCGDSVVTSIQARPLSEGGEISFGVTDNEERQQDMNEIPEMRSSDWW